MGTYNIHAGHAPSGFGACGAIGYLNESTEARNVKNELITALRQTGNTVFDCTSDANYDVYGNLADIVRQCNAHTVDLDISIHLNAASSPDASGVEVWYSTDNNVSVSKKISRAIADTMSIPDRGAKQSQSLYVLNETKANAILIECAFVTSKYDFDHWSCIKVGQAISSAITGDVPQQFGWIWDKGQQKWWYKHQDGTYTRNNWEAVDKKWYYFDGSGWMLKNQWVCWKEKWYFLDNSGMMVSDQWVWWKDVCYYLDTDGAMLTDNWKKDKEWWYYLDSKGHMARNCKVKWKGKVYFLGSEGKMLSNTVVTWDKSYNIDASGVVQGI